MGEFHTLTAKCNNCGSRLLVKSRKREKIVSCPKCNKEVTTFASEALQKPPELSESTMPSAISTEESVKRRRKLIKTFREQIHALGALWVFGGVVCGVFAAVGLGSSHANPLGDLPRAFWAFTAIMAVLWLILGVQTLLKQMWAVYFGLVLSYLSLLGQVLTLNPCAAIIAIVIILQAHRVIGWANQILAAGESLSARPK
jgi:hypothetical protein